MQQKYYLTRQGLEKIKKELKKLKKQRKVLLEGPGPRAFRFGEVEADYIAFRENLGRLEARISELEEILENYELIKIPPKKEQDKVHLGALVTVEVDDQEDEFFIVGTLEADPAIGKISNECPVGKALMGKKVGDEVVITSPIKIVYKIKKIRYGKIK
jgi:transcription elongation factor GreA